MDRVDMSVAIGDLVLANPVMTASGTFGSGKEYADLIDLTRLGAIVTKGVSTSPWSGNPSPRMAETASGMLNSIGLQNPGAERFIADDLAWHRRSFPQVPLVVNVNGHTIDEYISVVRRLDEEEGISAYEVNISCPNVDAGGMAFGTTCEAAAEVTRAVRAATSRTLIVKLSPNVTDVAAIARSVEAEGADAVSLINTLLGMAIDTRTFKPKLARVVGGLSGPAIKPIALRMVWQVSSAVGIPVIGMGGIASATDAVEFMLAGATAVAIGTSNFVDPETAVHIVDGLEDFCASRGIGRVSDLTGGLLMPGTPDTAARRDEGEGSR